MKDYVKYNDEVAKEIIETISCSTDGLYRLCKENKHWPHRSNIYRWVNENPSFRDSYFRAREQASHFWFDNLDEIACNSDNDIYIDEKGRERINHEVVNRSRLRVETRKWMIGKMSPKNYGDNKKEDNDGNSVLEKVHLAEVKE